MQELCLKWNEHHPAVFSVFEKLLSRGTFVDCTIAAESQYVKAHKLVLAACSPYFEMLFAQESEKNPIVVLKDVTFQELKNLIHFMYHGQVKLPKDELDAFIAAAESLQINGLSDQQKKKIPEKTANKTGPCREGRTSPVPRKRRKNSRTEPKEDSRGESSPAKDSSSDTRTCNNQIPSAEPLSTPSTSAVNCTPETAPPPINTQQGLTETVLPTHDRPSAAPEQVLPDDQVVKKEPEEITEPMEEIFLSEPKNEEYVDNLAMLESSAESEERQGSTSQQNTNNYSEFPSYDSADDSLPMNQMSDQSPASGSAASSTPAPASSEGQTAASGTATVATAAEPLALDVDCSSARGAPTPVPAPVPAPAPVSAPPSAPAQTPRLTLSCSKCSHPVESHTRQLDAGSSTCLRPHSRPFLRPTSTQRARPRATTHSSPRFGPRSSPRPSRHSGRRCSPRSNPRSSRPSVLGSSPDPEPHQTPHAVDDRMFLHPDSTAGTGERRRLRCRDCGLAFADVRALRLHRRAHGLLVPRERPNQCDLCGAIFTRAAYLEEHACTHWRRRPDDYDGYGDYEDVECDQGVEGEEEEEPGTFGRGAGDHGRAFARPRPFPRA